MQRAASLPRSLRRCTSIHSSTPVARGLHTSKTLRHGSFEKSEPKSPEEVVTVQVIDRNAKRHTIKGKVGDNLLYLMHKFQEDEPDLMLEGSCEASLACSTCHIIVDAAYYDLLPEPEEEEDDMLDLAACLTDTSRLGCQVVLNKQLEGFTFTLPSYSKNFYVDGHTPTPH